ncbi:type I-A CRISPR-associated protein Cas4/Csa1 [Sporolituus thermophilus]|uniref:CRISPR-associated protein, Csa1 family n=1 Tax=Sporolituus thermophilus DSM 23256 TaxID=1123285 RepID=A0A1G7P3C9_9FIRM|nr:type I-A CRISPR-associated protein Cas4/Csa1 [Sporolituus thermophilus]SDF80806.1 CRISPR-associated protein, Csa1 family [Sporolituus thermophilus DSM 23256]
MYFLTDDERKMFLKKMLPKARRLDIDEELRGWNWHQAPLEPVYEERLAVYEVSSGYCPTSRDLYLRRVLKNKLKPNFFMISGRVFHQIIVDVMENAKKQIYYHGTYAPEKLMAALRQPIAIKWPDDLNLLSAEQSQDIKTKGNFLRDYEQSRIAARIGEILTQQPYIGADSLAHLAIPLVCENKLDGRFLGLSQYLSADALILSEPMIIDLKFGAPQKFHRLSTTGYALAMEALYEVPVNLGCIVYGEFRNGRLIVTKDMHLIDDELRQWFIESRDSKMRMICEEIDPGIPEGCYEYCPGYEFCHQ